MSLMSCPWCGNIFEKDESCNWVCCGLTVDGFIVGYGCGMQWCFLCGKKLCTKFYDEKLGTKIESASDNHHDCCPPSEDFCPGGHNSHCERSKEWLDKIGDEVSSSTSTSTSFSTDILPTDTIPKTIERHSGNKRRSDSFR